MELKSISEIRDMSAEEAGRYIQYVESASSLSDVVSLVQDICNPNQLFPVDSDFVIKWFIAFAMEQWENLRYSILDGSEVFSDKGIKVLCWSITNSRLYHLFLNETQAIFLQDVLTALEANVVLDSVNGLTIESLQEDTENVEKYKDLFRSLLLFYPIQEVFGKVSDSLKVDESTTRFSSAIWFQEIQNKVIILAGCGGIGSYVAFLLSRMKPKALYIYDDDIVEVVNMAGQLYSSRNIGQYKVDALAAMIRDYSSYADVFAIRERFTRSTEAGDIMICGFDNMEARKTFFNSWRAHVEAITDVEARNKCLFIDGRLAAEELQVFCIRGDDTYNIEKYANEYLFSDADAEETLCSYKQTTYMANMIGSIMVNLFTNFVANGIVENLRDLPFFTSYDGSVMALRTQC